MSAWQPLDGLICVQRHVSLLVDTASTQSFPGQDGGNFILKAFLNKNFDNFLLISFWRFFLLTTERWVWYGTESVILTNDDTTIPHIRVPYGLILFLCGFRDQNTGFRLVKNANKKRQFMALTKSYIPNSFLWVYCPNDWGFYAMINHFLATIPT